MNEILITTVALALVIAIAWLVLKALSMNIKRGSKNGLVQVLETTPIGPKDRVVLLRYRNQEYLVAVGAQHIELLDKMPGNQSGVEAELNHP